MKIKRNLALGFITLFMIIGINIFSYSASISTDIDGMDEKKYPGYKEKIKEIQKIYPNIELLYTGLDWDTVIKNEYDLAHGRNLVETSKGDEWICQECKEKGIKYDSGLYCASEEAIRYMMDPRNFLSGSNLFQFQKLDTAVGTTTNEIANILKMQKMIYLQNDTDAIQAFVDVANSKKLNAYHLITRVMQEQGRTGTSILSSGNGYTGNGYTEYGKGYYNLFSINATRKTSDPVYMIYINAFDKAIEQGWDTRAKSILGGGDFVGNSYIDVGQNTLYLQKFAVYNTKGQLYWHQYMQNLFGAQSEASLLYSCYQFNGIQNSKDFVFRIPIFENMPEEPASKPDEKYVGTINSEVRSVEIQETSGGQYYLSGSIVVVEWVKQANGTYVSTVPRSQVKMKLESTDGTKIYNMYINQVDGHIYYFDINIANIDITKEYKATIEFVNSNNIAADTDKIMIVGFEDGSIGEALRENVTVTNKIIKFIQKNYIGDMNSSIQELNLIKNASGYDYITGNIVIVEWINGKSYIPSPLPSIILKSIDGTVSEECYIKQLDGHKYYFDKNITNIDGNKEYYLQLQSNANQNISVNSSTTIYLPDGNLGKIEETELKIKDNIIQIIGKPYYGNINSTVDSLNIITTTQDYISGNLTIVEWVKQEDETYISTVPRELPKLEIKSTDGEFVRGCYIEQIDGHIYRFDTPISDLDFTKEYYFELSLISQGNTSPNKIMKLPLGNRELKQLVREQLITEENILKAQPINYVGEMIAYIQTSNIIQNAIGENYISSTIEVKEKINGKTYSVEKLPVVMLKSTDGTYSEKCYLDKVSGDIYYFDKNIENIDKSKTYYLELNSGDTNNVGENAKIKIALKNQDFGIINKYQLKVENSNLTFKYVGDAYYGNLNTELSTMNIIKSGNNLDYITGEIIIVEWVKQKDGTYISSVPEKLPKITLKSTDGTINSDCYVNQIAGHRYYFDKNITGISCDKKYYLEVELTENNNISEEKIQKVLTGMNRNLGNNTNLKLVSTNNELIFSKVVYIGNINSELITTNKMQTVSGAEYLTGEIIIVEWVKQSDGTYVSTVPKKLPKIILKSTDGTINYECYVNQIAGHRYYFDRNITGLNLDKQYYLEISLTDSNNVSSEKTMKININFQ